MLRGSSEFEQAVVGSRSGLVKAEAWLGGRRIASDLPLVDGGVQGTSAQFVRRTANLEFADERRSATSSLSRTLTTPGCEVRVWSGVRVGERDWWLPVHWGLAENPTLDWRTGRLSLVSPDRSIRIAYDRFTRPRRSSAGFTVAQQIASLVRETLGPGTKFVDESNDNTAVTDVVWDRDRNDAITKLAASIGCETYWRPDGAWVLRPISSVIGVAALRVRQGVNLADASLETNWSDVRNHWVAFSDRADGSSFWGEDADTDPTSPTYVEGPFGRRTAFYSSSLFTTNSQCVTAARGFRYRAQGARVSVNYETAAHPGVEAGDRHDVAFSGSTHRLILDTFSLGLFSASMTGRGRSANAIPEES